MLPGGGCQKGFLYANTRLLARQLLLITPLISWVDKVHTSTIGVYVCFLIPCTSSELTGEARIYANNFSTIIEYKNARGFVNISVHYGVLRYKKHSSIIGTVNSSSVRQSG